MHGDGAQTGSKGFFGLYDVDGSASLANWPAGTDSNLNFWFGRRGIVSGSDAVRNRSKMYFYPQIKINNAVRLWGSYKIGGAGTRKWWLELCQHLHRSRHAH